MQRVLALLLVFVMLLGPMDVGTSAAAQTDAVPDLASVPLAVQELPEAGYQVLAGGYLSTADTARLIADPRNLDEANVLEWFVEVGLLRTYVLDLVLPEDRAWQESPFLAVTQTTVFLLTEDSGADEFISLLQNYANTAFVTELAPAVEGAYTVAVVGETGDQIRTLVSDGRVVLEIVSLDATGAPDETEHILTVEATLDRLNRQREAGDVGLSPMAFTLLPGESTANFGHSQQTGVHGLYRYRDAGIQPALGELGAEDQSTPPGLTSLYVSGGAAEAGGGTGFVSIWLGQFDSADSATSYFDLIVEGNPAGPLIDPYFAIAPNETWTAQGVLGVYRVTGSLDGQNYSGNVEIRQLDNVIVAIGYRTVGDTLPSTSISNAIMDHQLDCLEAQLECPPFELVVEIATPQATPVVNDSGLGSAEFGWSLPEPGPDWIVDEQFTDPGYDRIGLRNGVSIFQFESVINHHGEPVQCVLDELHLLEEFESHSVISVWEGADGTTDGGNLENQAWVVYRVEPLAEERADQEYVIRIDCFSLVPNSANLVMRHIAPVDFWDEEQPKGRALRDSVDLPETSISHGKLGLSAHDRRTTMILFHATDQVA